MIDFEFNITNAIFNLETNYENFSFHCEVYQDLLNITIEYEKNETSTMVMCEGLQPVTNYTIIFPNDCLSEKKFQTGRIFYFSNIQNTFFKI